MSFSDATTRGTNNVTHKEDRTMVEVTSEDRQQYQALMKSMFHTRGTEQVRAVRNQMLAIIRKYPKGHRIQANLQLMRSQ